MRSAVADLHDCTSMSKFGQRNYRLPSQHVIIHTDIYRNNWQVETRPKTRPTGTDSADTAATPVQWCLILAKRHSLHPSVFNASMPSIITYIVFILNRKILSPTFGCLDNSTSQYV